MSKASGPNRWRTWSAAPKSNSRGGMSVLSGPERSGILARGRGRWRCPPSVVVPVDREHAELVAAARDPFQPAGRIAVSHEIGERGGRDAFAASSRLMDPSAAGASPPAGLVAGEGSPWGVASTDGSWGAGSTDGRGGVGSIAGNWDNWAAWLNGDSVAGLGGGDSGKSGTYGGFASVLDAARTTSRPTMVWNFRIHQPFIRKIAPQA